MPNAFDGLGSEPYVPNYLQDEIQFRIDNDLRTVAIPPDGVVLGVVGDKNVNHVNFQMPAWYNGFDMSTFQARINFIDAEGNVNYYTVTDMTVMDTEGNEVTGTPGETDIIYFTWLVDSYATNYVGNVRFNVRLFKYDTSVSPATLSQAFNTQIGICRVLEGIQLADEITQEQAEDLLFHMTQELQDVTARLITDIETKGAETLENIPDDYTALSNEITSVKSNLNMIRTTYLNKFNKETITFNKLIDSSGNISNGAGLYDISDFIPTNGYFHVDYESTGSSIFRIAFYNEDKVFQQRIDFSQSSFRREWTGYIRIVLFTSSNTQQQMDYDSIMIVDGSNSVPYSPYYTAKDQYLRDKAFLNHKYLDSIDLNSLSESGSYLLSDSQTYTNAPFGVGIIVVYNMGTSIIQQGIKYNDGSMYYRRSLNGVWSEWVSVTSGGGSTHSYTNKIAMFGDSITWGTAPGGRTDKGLPYWVQQETGCDVTNFGVGSQGWVTQSPDGNTAIDNIRSHDLSGYDVITLQYGINDSNAYLGTYLDTTDNENSTIMSAMYEAVSYLYDTYPNVKIVIIAPTNTTNKGTAPRWRLDAEMLRGYTGQDMIEEYRKFADYYCLPFITYENCPANTFNISNLLFDNVHPNETGYKKYGQYLANQLKNYIN